MIRAKVGYEFYTFLTPEASRAIIEYLDYRDRKSEREDKYRQDQLLKQKIKYDKKGKAIGYLFVNHYISPEHLTIENDKEASRPRYSKNIYAIVFWLDKRLFEPFQ